MTCLTNSKAKKKNISIFQVNHVANVLKKFDKKKSVKKVTKNGRSLLALSIICLQSVISNVIAVDMRAIFVAKLLDGRSNCDGEKN